MSIPFYINEMINGIEGYGLPFTADNWNVTLTSLTPLSLLIPGTSAAGTAVGTEPKFVAIFAYTPPSDVYVSLNTVVVPPGAGVVKSSSQLRPTARVVKAGDTLHFETTDTTANFSISLYAIS